MRLLPSSRWRGLLAALLFILVIPVRADVPSARLFASTLPDPQGRPQALAGYRGRPLVVNFWARWCAPCREEIPELNAAQARHAGRVQVLGIGLEDDAKAVRDFLRQHPMRYPVLLAGDEAIPLMLSLGNRKGALPYTVFIAADGRIVHEKLGRLTAGDLAEGMERLNAPPDRPVNARPGSHPR